MAAKKVIKLVNNERANSKLESQKACDSTSIDTCVYDDVGNCTNYALDKCTKDYGDCSNGADDTCYMDYDDCAGPGEVDK
ncbi:MAG: hypothetical protein J6D21_08995 [Clostridia bacterium]|nr:hypothetical protein [Clostridia bacterium]